MAVNIASQLDAYSHLRDRVRLAASPEEPVHLGEGEVKECARLLPRLGFEDGEPRPGQAEILALTAKYDST